MTRQPLHTETTLAVVSDRQATTVGDFIVIRTKLFLVKNVEYTCLGFCVCCGFRILWFPVVVRVLFVDVRRRCIDG